MAYFCKCILIELPTNKKEILEAYFFSYGANAVLDEPTINNTTLTKVFFDNQDSLDQSINKIKEMGIVNWTTEEIKDQDWEFEWRKNYKPIKISSGFWVRPSWEELSVSDNSTVLVIDPKMTFGTGHHETTRICAELIEGSDIINKTVLDVGTGTGILSVIASKKNARTITAFDLDILVAENAKENIVKNNCSNINLFIGTADSINNKVKYDVIISNMIKTEIFSCIDKLASLIAKNGIIIFSGFLAKERDEAIQRAKSLKLEVVKEITQGEWIGFVFFLQN